ncbi:MAG: YhfC family intramembrane metalloprotease, partial [Coriobacteriales bacterium]|nr:YhfC family intramembrane metalloprotease [Coriobacteriales bacterium]
MVPTASIIFMGVTALIAFVVPIVLAIYFVRTKRGELVPILVGAAVFIVFALVLESLVHNAFLLHTGVGAKVYANPWLFAIYGGVMAGLFEETGRFTAFKTVLRKKQGNDANALTYGVGHGGCEAILLVGLSYISNIYLAVLINAGMADMLTAPLSGDLLEQMQAALDSLIYAPPMLFLAAGVERISAIFLHIALSVLVWFAAKDAKQRLLFPIAIGLHALVDIVAAACSSMG